MKDEIFDYNKLEEEFIMEQLHNSSQLTPLAEDIINQYKIVSGQTYDAMGEEYFFSLMDNLFIEDLDDDD